MAVPKYLELSLAPDIWHSVSLLRVEPDGSVLCGWLVVIVDAVRMLHLYHQSRWML